MRIIIFANGIIDNPTAEAARWVRPGDCVVAADGGTTHALVAGLTPAHVIGDLDSLSPEQRAHLEAAGTILHAHPPAKDETDLELALTWAAAQPDVDGNRRLGRARWTPGSGARQPAAARAARAGGTRRRHRGWRVDRPLPARRRDGDLSTGSPATRSRSSRSAAMLSASPPTGWRYPLRDETLRFGLARGVSNEFDGETATVSLRTGLLWCLTNGLDTNLNESLHESRQNCVNVSAAPRNEEVDMKSRIVFVVIVLALLAGCAKATPEAATGEPARAAGHGLRQLQRQRRRHRALRG